MGTNILDVKKELKALDQKMLDMLIKRFELNSFIADAKFALHETDKDFKIENEKRRDELISFFSDNALKKAKEKDFPNPEEFSKFITRISAEMLVYSWKMQKDYLRKKYDLKID